MTSEPLLLEPTATAEPHSTSEHSPVEVSPSGGKFTFWMICGVLLPLITIGVELATRMSAQSWVDPMPTTAHVVLALLVPLINFVVAIRLEDARTRESKRLAVAAGFSTGISALYALIYLPFASVSLILSVITEATGAVVLETAQDYERAGLKDPDDPGKEDKAMEGTPEPATWLTMGAGLAILFAARRKLQRAR